MTSQRTVNIRIFSALVFLAGLTVLCPPVAQAQSFIYTNNNLYQTTNTVTALEVGGSNLTLIDTYSVGGPGLGYGFYAAPLIASAATSSNQCLFVADGGSPASVAAFVVDSSTGTLTAAPGSPYYGAGSEIVVADNKLLLAGSYLGSASDLITVSRVNSDCSLTVASSTWTSMPIGMGVAPNGKYLIVTTVSTEVESYQIDYETGTLSAVGSFNAYGTGVEITCDSSMAYVTEPPDAIEVLSISPVGQLSEINVFSGNLGSGSAPSNAILSADGKMLYVSDALSGQITALATGPGGSLTYISTTDLKGSPPFTLGMTMDVDGTHLFVGEYRAVGALAVNQDNLTEETYSPFPVAHTNYPGVLAFPPLSCQHATATTLTSSLNPSIYGQSVTWTAKVTTTGPIPPTGTVNFKWEGYSIGGAPLNPIGVATLTRSTENADSYPLTAVYEGDANNAGSTSAVLNQVIKEATSSATLTASPNPSTQGQAVTFTATITSPTVAASGPVTFTAGKTVLGTGQLSGGKATFTTSTLPTGATPITATY